jgi:signal transduction histidine kinase
MLFNSILPVLLSILLITFNLPLHSNTQDSVAFLRNKVEQLSNSNPDSAFYWVDRYKQWSERNGNDTAYFEANRLKALIHLNHGNFQESIDLLTMGIDQLKSSTLKHSLARHYQSLAGVYMQMPEYETAVEHFFEALRLYEALGRLDGMGHVFNDLGIVHKNLNEFDKALEYYNKSLQYYEEAGPAAPQDLSFILKNIGSIHLNLNNYDDAMVYYRRALEEAESHNNNWTVMSATNGIAFVFQNTGELARAKEYFLRALAVSESMGSDYYISAFLINTGEVCSDMGDYKEAISYLEKGMQLAKDNDFLQWQTFGYKALSDTYKRNGDFERALEYSENYHAVSDSVRAEESKQKLAALETEYETKRKEEQIAILSKDNEIKDLIARRNRNFSIVVLVFSLLGMLITFMMFRNYKQKRTLREVELKQKADRQLLHMERNMMSAILETEDKERKRFASDLHDDLGPLLSSIKLYLGELPETPQEEQPEMFAYTCELIDHAIQTTRNLSYNIMPGALLESGLQESLEDFARKISRTKAIDIRIGNQIGEQRFKNSMEVILFRVVVELINNTLKHAKASLIRIDLARSNGNLQVDYQDNGTGFDIAETLSHPEKGIGLQNIIRRIDSLGGKLDFESTVGKGTAVHIEVAV